MIFLLELVFGNLFGCPVDFPCLHHYPIHAAESSSSNLINYLVIISELSFFHLDKLVPFDLNFFNRFGSLRLFQIFGFFFIPIFLNVVFFQILFK